MEIISQEKELDLQSLQIKNAELCDYFEEIEKFNKDLEEMKKIDDKIRECIKNRKDYYTIKKRDLWKENINSERIVIIYKDDRNNYDSIEYIGYLKNRKYEGYGKKYSYNKISSQGFFKDNELLLGIGIDYSWSSRYIRYFKNGKFNGFGKLFSDNNLLYLGNFNKNKYDGKGCIFYENGKI